MSWTIIDKVDQILVILILRVDWVELSRLNVDIVPLVVSRLACFRLLGIDGSQDITFGSCKDDLVSQSLELHKVTVSLEHGRHIDISILRHLDVSGCHKIVNRDCVSLGFPL